ncbi:MAG: VanW family protein [Capsulimonadaceae bacterium]
MKTPVVGQLLWVRMATSLSRLTPAGAAVSVVLAGASLALWAGATPSRVLAAYSTDLATRTPHQRYNARRAAAALDGRVISPGALFSFNDTLRGWTAEQGFLKAPVSYDGTLVDDYGGGVCETSTTLYNAALLAGMEIVGRHPHAFSPGYVPPGRDAAVAYPGADLRLRNPYSWPVTIRIGPLGSRLVCRLECPRLPAAHVSLRTSILGRLAPTDAPVDPGQGRSRSRWRLRGRDGLRVAVTRSWTLNGRLARVEEVSDDNYLPISRIHWAP